LKEVILVRARGACEPERSRWQRFVRGGNLGGLKTQESNRSRPYVKSRAAGAGLFLREEAVGAPVRGPIGSCRKARERKKGLKELFDLRKGEKLWRVKPRSVGGWKRPPGIGRLTSQRG
jgi:hypothetical protein